MEQSEVISGYLTSIGLDSWVVQVFAVVFITLLLNFFQRRTMNHLEETLKKSPTIWDGVVVNALRRPLGVLVWVVGLAFAIEIIQREAGATIFEAVEPIRDLGIIATIAWFMVRLIKNVEINLITQREQKGEPIDRTTLDAIAKLLRLSVLITATLVALQTLGFSISGVLAFGGIGGIAVGFAAKDLLANFFGGLMVYLDRPFAVGDWVRSPDQEIEGTVEIIGWRQTLIRTFDSRPLYVPNSTFTNISVENPSRMQNRRIYEVIGIRYDDADEMAGVVDDVTEMLRTHPEIAADLTLMVNFNAFAPSSLDFFIYCFTKTTKWAKYHGIKQDVLLKILAIINDHGAEVAFPTSTIHIPNGLPPGPPLVQL
ncbi:MAG: MscS family membrane protein [Parasphingorhabdus sp.]|jgi:MscS family membrane protein